MYECISNRICEILQHFIDISCIWRARKLKNINLSKFGKWIFIVPKQAEQFFIGIVSFLHANNIETPYLCRHLLDYSGLFFIHSNNNKKLWPLFNCVSWLFFHLKLVSMVSIQSKCSSLNLFQYFSSFFAEFKFSVLFLCVS